MNQCKGYKTSCCSHHHLSCFIIWGARLYMYIYICLHTTYIYIYIHTYIYMYDYVCICNYTYVYIHTCNSATWTCGHFPQVSTAAPLCCGASGLQTVSTTSDTSDLREAVARATQHGVPTDCQRIHRSFWVGKYVRDFLRYLNGIYVILCLV